MKKHKTLKIFAIYIAFVLLSCSGEEKDLDTNAQNIPDEVIEKVKWLGLSSEGIMVTDFEFPDGTKQPGYLVEGDIALTSTQLESLNIEEQISTEQYRSLQLVNSPRTISVIGFIGTSIGLTPNMQIGLLLAINNYNALNLSVNFTITFQSSFAADIVVYRETPTQIGGSSGYPSNGDPYPWVQLFSGLDSQNENVNEHVVTHMIGHAIGMAHTTPITSQCNLLIGQAPPGGTIHIPGTPLGNDPTSIMSPCLNLQTDGEFNSNDITALQFTY